MVGIMVIIAVVALVIFAPIYLRQINEERDLVKQWLQVYGEYDPELDEDDLDEFMDLLKKWDIHPVEIYRGSMIFYGKGYGYVYIPGIEDDLRPMPPGMMDTSRPDTKFVNLAKKHGGTTTVFIVSEKCFCFQNLSDAENFLAELWSV